MSHVPVLLNEIRDGLSVKAGETVVDATTGGGGHTEMFCKKVGETGRIIALDVDTENLTRAKERLANCPAEISFLAYNFRNIDKAVAEAGSNVVDVVLFDLGLSNMHLTSSGRGFTFQNDEPLSMTFADTEAAVTAYTVVNEWAEETIADILYGFGDERFARRIARRIADARETHPIETTHALVSVIEESIPRRYRSGKTHPATKTFQAIRMAVNDEWNALHEALEKTTDLLNSSGRVAVISYHSGEDRIVKQFFKEKKGEGTFIIHTKKPITPSREEIQENPKARSAKLRIAQKI